MAQQHLMEVGCNIKERSIMKRYLFILFAAMVALTSCDTIIQGITDTKKGVEVCIVAEADENTTWEVGDRITVSLSDITSVLTSKTKVEMEIKSASDINGKRATFKGNVPTGKYYSVVAFYPAAEIEDNCAVLYSGRNNMWANKANSVSPVLTVTEGAKPELELSFAPLMHKLNFDITLDEETKFNSIIIEMSAKNANGDVKFTTAKAYEIENNAFTPHKSDKIVTIEGTSKSLSTLLFPMDEANIAFSCDVYLDGVKRYVVSYPKEGKLDNYITKAGESSTMELDLRSAPKVSYVDYKSNVDAKGLTASISLSDVAYIADDKSVEIANVRFEYAHANSTEWKGIDINGSEFANSKVINLPLEGNSYLKENNKYLYRLTFTPKDDLYEVKTSKEASFTTAYAEVTAEIAKPVVTIENNMVNINIDDVRPYFDGIYIPDYEGINYCIVYRKSGSNTWLAPVTATYSDKSMTLAIAESNFDAGVTYEFAGAIVAGASNTMVTSEITNVTMPKADVPAPPVSGDADTSNIAGEWHLTKWRGTEPSFDVYLSITEDGVVSLFQRMESRLWETFYSVVGYEDGIIAGEYTDGVAWAHSYYVTVEGNTMTWTSTTDANEISVYTRCTLPDITNPDIRVTATQNKRFF